MEKKIENALETAVIRWLVKVGFRDTSPIMGNHVDKKLEGEMYACIRK